MKKVLITGHSSGLGRGLAEEFLSQGWMVYGLARRQLAIRHAYLREVSCDLAEVDGIAPALDQLLEGQVDLVILNAGVLGEIQPLHQTAQDELDSIMQINVWANKHLLDALIQRQMTPEQIVLISSGAAVNGNYGWGGYALSKATLNMLTQLYAHELPDSHFTAFAPGLVDTAMQDYLCDEADAGRYPSLQKLIDARDAGTMPRPDEAARRIYQILPQLKNYPSGGFIDIRNMP